MVKKMYRNSSFLSLSVLEPYRINQYSNVSYVFFCFVIACAYSLFMASMPGDIVTDRVNYINYADNSTLILLSSFNGGFFSLMFNEPLWLILNIVLSFLLTSEGVVDCIILVSSFSVSYYILRVNPKAFIFLLLILFFPQVLGKFIVHLRQGFAISIFFIALMCKKESLKFILIMITPFFHSSFFIIVFMLFIMVFFRNIKLSATIEILILIAVSIFIGMSLISIGSLLEARQTNQEQLTVSVSGLGFLFWLSLAALYITGGKKFIKKYIFSFSFIVLYLTTYFFNPYLVRVFESIFVLVILMALGLSRFKLTISCGLFLILFLFTYLPRINKPLLGFGVE